MNTLYWDKERECYVGVDVAMAKGMHGIRRHHFVDKNDLIEGGGLPLSTFQYDNSNFYIPYTDRSYRLPSPRDNALNIMTLEPWAGEVVVVESNFYKGVIDVNTGELLIPCERDNYAIYPISKDYFIILNRDTYRQKIVNRNNQVLDEVYGNYHKSKDGDKIFRHVLDKKTKKSKCDGRITINSLKRHEQNSDKIEQLKNVVIELRNAGYGDEAIHKLVDTAYNTRNKKSTDNTM